MNKSVNKILISFGVLIMNVFISHYFPIGIMLIPLVLILISTQIGVSKDLKPIWKSVLLSSFIIIHDVGIKLYAGGKHDYEGLGWIHGLLLIGLIPAYLILIICVFNTKKDSIFNKWLAVILFPLLIWVHLLINFDLGV